MGKLLMTTNATNAVRRALTDPNELVTYHNDPNFYTALDVLPNPDPILAKLGKDQSVYTAIQYDSHVMGELRSLRSGLLGYEWRIKAGADDPDSLRAHELIQAQLGSQPVLGLGWSNWHWSIYKAVLQGQALHEVGWHYDGRYLWPSYIKERPPQRFRYNLDNELRYLTRLYPIQGESAPDVRRFLITRHMASHDNPYGVAVLSACFWPYTFKHSGWKWFAKFAEKYGIPWAIGRYPTGADTKQQQELAQRLAAMIEDAVAAIPEGTGVELLSAGWGGTGDPIQERLINLSNREMSKALTSQTLSSEQVGNGSRAASETHRERQMAIAVADRAMVSETINQLLTWITELNFPNAIPPKHEFYQEEDARKNWADTLEVARKYLPIGRRFAYERLQIEPPTDEDELITSVDSNAASFHQSKQTKASDFKKADTEPLQQAIDGSLPVADTLQKQTQDLLEPLLNRAQTLFEQGTEPEQIIIELMSSFPLMDSKQLEETLTHVLYVAELAGQWEAQQDIQDEA
jgi:phage gp29-like protein